MCKETWCDVFQHFLSGLRWYFQNETVSLFIRYMKSRRVRTLHFLLLTALNFQNDTVSVWCGAV